MNNKLKNNIILLLVSIFLFLGCSSKNKKNEVQQKQDNSFYIKLDEYFQKLKTLKKFNGVVLIEQEGKRLLFEVYNMSESDTSSLRVVKESQFDIHSISKLMAKAVIVDLEKENLISVTDKVSSFIPNFPNGNRITIKHLLDNQSGLPRGLSVKIENLIEKNSEEIIELIKQEKLLFEPGSDTVYSNLGYQLLYYIISKITKKPFVQYLNEKYFQPLNMKSTGAHFYLKKNNLNNLVKNHEKNDKEIIVVPNIGRNDKNQAKIYSTVEDLLLFINHIKNSPYREKIKNNSNKIGWSGGGDGILSHLEHDISKNYELVFFSNYDEIPFGDILKTVDRIMNNQSYELPRKINRKEIEVSENILKRSEGKYRVKEFNNHVFEYKVENKKLVMYQNGEKNGVLKAETENTFFGEPEEEDYFEFRKINEGYKLIFHYKKIEIEGVKE